MPSCAPWPYWTIGHIPGHSADDFDRCHIYKVRGCYCEVVMERPHHEAWRFAFDWDTSYGDLQSGGRGERPVSYGISRRETKTDRVGFKAGDTVGGAHVVGNKVSGMGFQSACQSTKSCACMTANSMVRAGINVSVSNPFRANQPLRARLYSLVVSNCRCRILLRALQIHQWRRLAKCMVIWGWRPMCEDTQDEGAFLDPFAGRRAQR